MDPALKPKAKPVFALVDVNNFYVSCKRVINPKLPDMPMGDLDACD